MLNESSFCELVWTVLNVSGLCKNEVAVWNFATVSIYVDSKALCIAPSNVDV